MDCIEIICLYLKHYLSAEQFQTIVYAHLHAFEHALPESVYLDLLSATFRTKEETIHLETELRNDVLRHHPLLYDKINDAFMERWIAANPGDTVTEILKKRDEKRAEVSIDCSSIRSASELIYTFKQALKYPETCGNNWDAIADFIDDILFSQKLTFDHWCDLEEKLPQDTAILKFILDKVRMDDCIITYGEEASPG